MTEMSKMPLQALKAAPYNPRSISTEALSGLKSSIKRFGLVQPIVWNKRSGHVVGGHQRIRALESMGQTQADVCIVDLSEAEEKTLNVALNNPSIEGEFTETLAPLLAEISEKMPDEFLSLQLDRLLEEVSKGIENKDLEDDEIPPAPINPTTKRGDLIELGRHVLLCGDSTSVDDVKRVIPDGASMIFTDPPWNVAIGQRSTPKHRQRSGLQNDDLGEEFGTFLHAWTAACLPHLKGDLYCVMGSREWPAIDKALRDAGTHWSAVIVWVKESFVIGRRNYHPRFEPIWYGWPQNGTSSYVGKRDQDDVWEFARPRVSQEHPTMKPINLVAKAVQNSSVVGERVFDPFGGAGSTLLASEKLGRVCSTIEIDPKYCDVIVKRWETATGKKAKRP